MNSVVAHLSLADLRQRLAAWSFKPSHAPRLMRAFYADTVENVEAWLEGKPLRVLNPEAPR